MKKKIFIFICVSALFASCESVNYDTYTFVLPLPSESGIYQVLGTPCWHIEWTDENGDFREAEIAANSSSSLNGLSVFALESSAIIAYPYWPDKKILRGIVKPSGAIFPFDAKGNKVYLTHQGGVDAVFYREINKAKNEKRPAYQFDWVRFRSLFSDGSLGEEISGDPWLADWHSIAERTAASGFDKRRIKPSKLTMRSVTVPLGGTWIGSSPFEKAKTLSAGALIQLGVKENSDEVESYFCTSGTLHVNTKVSSWVPF
ncbi:MAG: hypothetical protein Ta2G_07420 [Termitinemataceae bacterium]|nr:MAG: hypothetical protein Ta2G_07420 [Termitinemataceae bacterium]